MGTRTKALELSEESIVDDEIIIIIGEDDKDDNEDENYTEDDFENDWIECMDCVQRKLICVISIFIIGMILLVFVYTLNKY
tara:strand:- start:8911 stop:9153 length:243 start_codon:yes stop_codon:yes gene_type:complete